MTALDWARRVATAISSAFQASPQDQPDEPKSTNAASNRDAMPEKASTAPSPPVTSVYANSIAQWRTAVNWLIVALGAVATAMIAGSQLSSIGELSADTERDRLLLAVGGLAVAVGLVLLSIGLLFWAQSPSNTDFSRLKKLAAGTLSSAIADEVRRQVSDDTSLNRGKGSLAGLWKALSDTRTEYYGLSKYHEQLARKNLREEDETKKRQIEASLKRLDDELDIVQADLREYRTGVQLVAFLDAFLRTRQRFRIASFTVLVLSVFATFGFVIFAWAANPPADPAEAAPQRPVDATLKLTSDGQDALGDQLGATCAVAAAVDGIRVIALSSSDKGIEVVVVATADCPEPRQLTVSSSNGTVSANHAVILEQ